MKKEKKKSRKGKLIKYHTTKPKHISEITSVIGSKDKGFGIYALYNRGKLVYVGLSERSLRSRLRSHARTKKGKWSHFKWWQVKNDRYIKDIESLILQINQPKLNKIKGKMKKKYRVK